jgi:hypothetical protein
MGRERMGLVHHEAAEAAAETMEKLVQDDGSSVCQTVHDNSCRKAMKRGRSTTSREKPPYEQPMKRSRFYTIL